MGGPPTETRVIQLATEAAYLLLAVSAILAAIRQPIRARIDVALLFGILGLSIVLQETLRLAGVQVEPIVVMNTVLSLALPVLLIRLVDNFHDVPLWVMLVAVGAFLVVSGALALSPRPAPPPVTWLAVLYLAAGLLYVITVFLRRASATAGITSRRMWSAAAACGLLVFVVFVAGINAALPQEAGLLQIVSQVASLFSGLAFYAAFFPPQWLRQSWRLPEFFGYLRATRWAVDAPGRLDTTAPGQSNEDQDQRALDTLLSWLVRTTGGQRGLLALVDSRREDIYIWGAPDTRFLHGQGILGRVIASGRAEFVPQVRIERMAPAIRDLFEDGLRPRAALAVPVFVHGRCLGALGVYAQKGPIFLEDDLDVVTFFATEAAAVLRGRQHRETATELAALREADRLKDEFMAVVSHELRTPLTAISGYADILLRQMSGTLNDRQARQVVGIRDAARRLLSLINDLLDVSKLEAGTLELRLTGVDTRAALERAVGEVRVIAAGTDVHVEAEEPATAIPPVYADKERLQQILVNLLTNAVKFTPAHGTVFVSVAAEESPEGPCVAFLVRDTGIGLTSEQINRVWERFYQAEASSSRRFGGTGLGLSIVKRLVELHGGTVDARSSGTGQGSTFVVRIPAAGTTPDSTRSVAIVESPRVAAPMPTRPPDHVTVPADLDRTHPLVLVVEDDPDIAAVITTYLEQDGYSVLHAPDGQQALRMAREARPFAILLDVVLPKLDGWSVINVLKREPLTAHIPVIVVSIVDNRQFGMVLGASDYLVKPVSHDQLQRVLRQIEHQRAGGDEVLVVDDDPAVLDVLGTSLEHDGWRTRTAADGVAALEAIQQERPAIVLLDLMMPRLDGFQVLERLRGDAQTRDLPVVVLTAKDLTPEERASLAERAERVILKEARTLTSLLDQVRAALAAHRPSLHRDAAPPHD